MLMNHIGFDRKLHVALHIWQIYRDKTHRSIHGTLGLTNKCLPLTIPDKKGKITYHLQTIKKITLWKISRTVH